MVKIWQQVKIATKQRSISSADLVTFEFFVKKKEYRAVSTARKSNKTCRRRLKNGRLKLHYFLQSLREGLCCCKSGFNRRLISIFHLFTRSASPL
ncbi:hypothetical protein QT995_09190 [Microcoleus sp. S36b_A3]|uniref:hypothetical protein n=1 Tax=unclassified Microcoleus TaxID=2642155 RepID=UPI002FCFB91A